MNQEKSLVERLVSRISFKSYNPTKGKKKDKEPVSYFHVSTKTFDRVHPETGVISQFLIGTTYRKP